MRLPLFGFTVLFALSACDSKTDKTDKTTTGTSNTSPSQDSKTKEVSSSDGPLFKKSIRDRTCDFITPELVKGAIGLDVSGYSKQDAARGNCFYRSDAGHTLGLVLDLPQKSVKSAKFFFAQATKNMDKKDIGKAFDKINKTANKRVAKGKLGAKAGARAKAVGARLGGALHAFSYEDVAGVSDEAKFQRITSNLGGTTEYTYKLVARKGNLAFNVIFECGEDATSSKEKLKKLGSAVHAVLKP